MRENKSNLALMYRFVLAFTVVLNEKRIIASEGMNEMQHMYIWEGAWGCALSRHVAECGAHWANVVGALGSVWKGAWGFALHRYV